ncbi:copper chaperone PCu(A)C [Catenulispora rubra]|uniref:copper chaperone PCu(A)C n=1 Tax=Catenulispora rubra TaxID=280293 RepID=UPI0018925350|nr:copper chaperone PCu(A)C [Catenulispora rubra]
MNLPLKTGALVAPVAVLAAGAGLLLWSGGDAEAHSAKLAVSDAYVREPANPAEAAAYFTVANKGGGDDTLTGVTASTGRATMHTTNGALMVALSSAPVPAHGSLDFSPGGNHLMIDDPGPLKPGTTVRLTLTFAASGPITVTAPVIGILDPAPGQ